MNVKDILANIPNNAGAGYFTVYLPSMDKELRIRHLGIKDQKIISKLAINENRVLFASESDLAKLALIESNALESIDLEDIDIRDYFILCCAIRKENYLNNFNINIKCNKCNNEFDIDLDFKRLIESATEFESEISEKIIDSNAGKMNLKIGLPKQVDLIMLEMYYNTIAETRDVSVSEKYIDYIIACIQEISIENAELKDKDSEEIIWDVIEDFNELEFIEKIEFVQKLNPNIEELSKIFSDVGIITSNFFYDVKCPLCKEKMSTFMDTSDFFML